MDTTWLDPIMRTPCILAMRTEVGKDEYGNTTYAETQVEARCYLETSATAESDEGRAGTDTWLVLLPGMFADKVDPSASIFVAGVWKEVPQPAMVLRRPRDPERVHHDEVVVTRSTTWGR